MGTNVIHLSDWAVPSYRRHRAATSGTAPTDSAWSAMARRRAAQKSADAQAAGQRTLALVPPAAPAADTPSATGTPTVRVTRLVDARQPAADSGRLRISGRLIDVCAELDRLAAAEAQGALPRRA
ncbi:MAG: hypothetical protein Q4G70_10255 [Pseudomonadota bacterium]|nr:hypothetical protein [Pseudomonadota bacterium]